MTILIRAAMLAAVLSMTATTPVQGQTCSPVQACGDVDASGSVASSDALKVLKKAVGQNEALVCTCGGGSGTCQDDLATCNTDLGTCSEDLTTSESGLASCGTNLGQCNANLTGCGIDLADAEADLTQCQGVAQVCQANLAVCIAAPECGDGAVEGGEDCDVGNLDGETCAGRGFAGGTLGCTFCAFDTSRCYAARLNASGPTIIDRQTGLEWEKKLEGVMDGVLHNVYDLYAWSEGSGAPNGAVFTDFLVELNAPTGTGSATGGGPTTTGCYAEHCDWRLPTIEELRTIAVADCGSPPCVVDPVFLPTRAEPSYDGYWSSSTVQATPGAAWMVRFTDGGPIASDKSAIRSVRAVRNRSLPAN